MIIPANIQNVSVEILGTPSWYVNSASPFRSIITGYVRCP